MLLKNWQNFKQVGLGKSLFTYGLKQKAKQDFSRKCSVWKDFWKIGEGGKGSCSSGPDQFKGSA